MANNELTPPHSPESERAIVGCALMSHAEIYVDVADVRTQDFYLPHHRNAWDAIKAIEKRGGQINLASFLDEIRTNGTLSTFDGAEMWPSLCASESPMPQTIGSYVATLKKHSTLRRIIAMCVEGSARAHGAGDLDGIIESLRAEIAAIEVDADDVGPVRLADVIDKAVETIGNRASTTRAKMGTGISALDERTGGLRPRLMSVWAGLPGMGKTAAALSVVARNVAAGIPCILFSLEMDRQDIVERALSMKSKVPCQFLINGKARGSTMDWPRVQEAAKDIALLPFWVDDRTLTCNQICGETNRWYAKHVRKHAKQGELPEALVVVDYLGQIPSEERAENRNREIAKMVHRLKATAKSKTMNIHVMVLSQLSNEAAKRGGFPQSSDMRDSGEIWAAADLVVFPWRDKQQELLYSYKQGQEPFSALHIIDKNKSGQVGLVEVFWLGPSMTYVGQDEWREENR